MGLYDFTFYDLIDRNARSYKNQPAWLEADDGRALTFGQFKDAVDRLASGLQQRGIEKGDRIGVVGKNSPEYFLLYGAAAALGAIGIGFVGLILASSLFIYRPWCHFFCPFGLVGWLVEKITGMPFQDALSKEIWTRIGAEADASIYAARYGIPLTTGGLLARPRDVARFVPRPPMGPPDDPPAFGDEKTIGPVVQHVRYGHTTIQQLHKLLDDCGVTNPQP